MSDELNFSVSQQEKILVLRAKMQLAALQGEADRFSNSPMLQAALSSVLKCEGKLNRQIARLDKAAQLYEGRELTDKEKVRLEYAKFQKDVLKKQHRNFTEEAQRRKKHLSSIRGKKAIAEEIRRCREDVFYWWDNYAWTADPRNPVFYAVPFRLYDYQREFVERLDSAINVEQCDLLCEKSRAVGLTWLLMTYFIWKWLFPDNEDGVSAEQFLCTTLREVDCDKVGVPSSMLEKARMQLRFLPDWMLPEGFKLADHAPSMRIINPVNGSLIMGTTTNGETGRSGRWKAIFFDEAASVKDLAQSAAAASQSTESRIFVSTPRGEQNYFYELRQSGDVPILTYWWYQNPYLDERWFNYQRLKMSKAALAQEILIDYTASQSDTVFPEFDEKLHVLSWSEFGAQVPDALCPITGRVRIPHHWLLGRFHDWGSSEGHANVTMWAATAPEGTVLKNGRDISGNVFVYRLYVAPPHCTIRTIANAVISAEAADSEYPRMNEQRMSHERLHERIQYNEDYGLAYDHWKLDFVAGITRIKDYLEPEGTDEHPFRHQFNGTPAIFFVGDDEQCSCVFDEALQRWMMRPAENDDGLARLRAEFKAYHWDTKTGLRGANAQRPVKTFDDAMDCLRGLGIYTPVRKRRDAAELFEENLPEALRRNNLVAAVAGDSHHSGIDAGQLWIARQAFISEHKLSAAPSGSRRQRILGRRV